MAYYDQRCEGETMPNLYRLGRIAIPHDTIQAARNPLHAVLQLLAKPLADIGVQMMFSRDDFGPITEVQVRRIEAQPAPAPVCRIPRPGEAGLALLAIREIMQDQNWWRHSRTIGQVRRIIDKTLNDKPEPPVEEFRVDGGPIFAGLLSQAEARRRLLDMDAEGIEAQPTVEAVEPGDRTLMVEIDEAQPDRPIKFREFL